MVEENEIRIGNWFKHKAVWSSRNENSEVLFFQWEASDWYAVGECTLFLEDIEPIGITKDILNASGFKKTTFNKDEKDLSLGGIYLWSRSDNEVVFDMMTYSNNCAPHLIKCILSVHELQNIYFDFTKKELEIKL